MVLRPPKVEGEVRNDDDRVMERYKRVMRKGWSGLVCFA